MTKAFKISQAFFPADPDTWEKLQRALKAQFAPEASDQMLGTASFLFEVGEHQCIAGKVIDFLGNETFQMMPCT
jgi:adenine-specific DNA-methyltransferase